MLSPQEQVGPPSRVTGKEKAEGGGGVQGGGPAGSRQERSPSSRSLGQPLGGLDFSAEELLVEWGESSLDHDGVQMLEGLQLFHMLAAQAPKLPLGWQLEMS